VLKASRSIEELCPCGREGNTMKVRAESSWAKRPMWQKRLHGFASYMLAALTSLAFPVETDKAMFDSLRDQFDEKA
jgi:hypothetical protein